MKIILRMNDINFDLTPISDINNLHKEVEMQFSTEGTFNSASFIMPSVDRYELGQNIDFSRGIIRNSLVTIERDNIEYQWRVMSDIVSENQNGTYSHTVQLIDRRSETTGINLPGLALTQSKSIQGNHIKSVMTIPKTDTIGNSFYDASDVNFLGSPIEGVNMIRGVTPNWPFVPTELKIQSEDTSVIDGVTLKELGRRYTISLGLNLVNTQANYKHFGLFDAYTEYYEAPTNYVVYIRVGPAGGSHPSEYTIERRGTLPAATVTNTSWPQSIYDNDITVSKNEIDFTFDYTPEVESVVSIQVYDDSVPNLDLFKKKSGGIFVPEEYLTAASSISITDLRLIITTPENIDPSRKTLADHINRILDNIFIDEVSKYKLSDNSQARLSQIISPEFTIEGYNLFQAIQEVADFLGSSWQINSSDEIDFIFFDDDNIINIDMSEKQSQSASSDLNEYASSIQLNAENIASNTTKKEIGLTVRSLEEGNSQITTDNLMIKTEDPVNYIKSVIVSGLSLTLNGVPTLQDWDITNRIITKEQWDILESDFDPSSVGKDKLMKNNTLYFIRGKNGLHGLSYLGGDKPGFVLSEEVNRSLFETVAAQAYEVTGLIASNKDQGISTHNSISYTIEYFPFTSSKVHIYKDDQSGFQIERHKYFNESSKVNDPDLIGKVAQNNVNRLGGTEYTTTGYTDNLNNIPKLGTIDSNGRRLTKIIIQTIDSYIRFTSTYISEYTKISKFVGQKSDYRLYEIPNTSVILSDRIKRSRILIGSTIPLNNYTTSFLNNLTNSKTLPPKLAKITFSHSTGSNTVYTTVSTNNFGKTGSWKIKALNNYSFGSRKVTKVFGGENVDYQEEVRYTDFLGNVESVDVTYYSDYKAGDEFPLTATDLTLLIPSQTFLYNKDARETFSMETEVSFGSTDLDKYRIYDGITKYNTFINGNIDYNIKCRVLNYIPNRNDLKVDLSRTNGLASISKTDTRIWVTSIKSGIGLVFYDDNTNDILLVVKDNISFGTYSFPYGAASTPVYRTVIFNTNGGSYVPNQTVLDGTVLTEPVTTREGYDFGGWYTDPTFAYPFVFSTPITMNWTLYAKWIPNLGRVWERVYTTIYDFTSYPQVYEYTCPADYTALIPDANNYDIGYTINVIPYRYCDPGQEVCYENPITMTYFQVCEAMQFRVIEE